MSEKHQDSPRLLGFAAAAAILGVVAVWATLPTVKSRRGENTQKLPVATVPQTQSMESPKRRIEITFCGPQAESGCANKPGQAVSHTTPALSHNMAQLDFVAGEVLGQTAVPTPDTAAENTLSETAETAETAEAKSVEMAALAPAAGANTRRQREAQSPAKPAPSSTATGKNTRQKSSGKTYLLVIGSFVDPAHAEKRHQRFAAWNPQIRQKRLKGKNFHRVLLGPYDGATLKQARKRIFEAGIADNWALPVPVAATAQQVLMALPKES